MTWQTKKLGEICDFQNGFAFKSSEYVNSGFFVMRIGNVQDGYISLADPKYIKKSHKPFEKFIIQSGDILISLTGNVGRVGVVEDVHLPAVINQRVARIVLKNKNIVQKQFFLYFLKSSYFIEKLIGAGHGAAQQNISTKDIENLEIPLPPLPEQLRIVKILDEVFKKVAKAKENAEKNLQNSRQLFESYLQSVFANPGEGWEEKRLKDIGETQTGLTPKTSNKEYYGHFVPFIAPADIDFLGDGSIRYDNKGLSEEGLKVGRKIEKNSVLMVCIGATIGKVGFATEVVSCNQQINALTPGNKQETKIFYYLLSTKSFFNKILKGSSQATLPIINKSKWENLTVTFPKSLSEQKSIISKLDALSAETKKLEGIYRQKLGDLEELKKSVLKKAFKGEL